MKLSVFTIALLAATNAAYAQDHAGHASAPKATTGTAPASAA